MNAVVRVEFGSQKSVIMMTGIAGRLPPYSFPGSRFEIVILSSLPPSPSTFSFNRVLQYGSGWLPIHNLLASAS